MFLPALGSAGDQIQLDDLLTPDELLQELDAPSNAQVAPPEEPFREETQISPHAATPDGTFIDPSLAEPTEDVLSILDSPEAARFPVVLSVNTAASGRTAQVLYAFVGGREHMRVMVSTGREQWEVSASGRRYFTSTARAGLYQPTRVVQRHYSKTWKTWLKWMVFFNGGVGLHATSFDHYDELGRRASGGCVRQREEHAAELFRIVTEAGNGLVPRLRNLAFSYQANGEPKLQQGPRTLIQVRRLED
ncbi:MAG: L,D-transpeptidase [Bdellovibrionales bacterium]|nr:L,D-transpeptidase [Bdellovibrionales bacterium]